MQSSQFSCSRVSHLFFSRTLFHGGKAHSSFLSEEQLFCSSSCCFNFHLVLRLRKMWSAFYYPQIMWTVAKGVNFQPYKLCLAQASEKNHQYSDFNLHDFLFGNVKPPLTFPFVTQFSSPVLSDSTLSLPF